MTEKELQAILSMVEDIIAKKNGDICHQVANLIRNLKVKYQTELVFIIDQINIVLAKHNIDCSTRGSISGDEIDKYVAQNAPDVEIFNE
jgi:hypothetical protein